MKVETRCGLICEACTYKEPNDCKGCIATMGNPFHGECPVAQCAQKKGIVHCGQCDSFPCALLEQYSCDPVHGDTPPGARIAVCRMWKAAETEGGATMSRFEEIKAISEEAYAFMNAFEADKIADGRHELGGGVYANISTYTTRTRAESMYEAHRKYIDIQWIISGREIISTEPLNVMHGYACLQPYNEENDCELYANNFDGIDHYLEEGCFAVYLPEIAHMPNICAGGPSKVRKVVIKVPVKG